MQNAAVRNRQADESGAASSDAAPVRPAPDATATLRPLGMAAVRVESGFWLDRQVANRHAVIDVGYERLRAAGNLDNLEAAARGDTAYAYRGPMFMDSDVYKWLEAAAWEHAREPSAELAERFAEVVRVVSAAQQPDGYLNSFVQVTRGGADRYADLAFGHELYCFGHLFQAAVAARRALGDETLWAVARAAADHVAATFGAGGNPGVPGHPLVEMALVEMARESGERRYAQTAAEFVRRRGRGTLRANGREPIYFSDRVPVRDAVSVEGHAVRAMYLASGATDVVIEGLDDADDGYLQALRTQWEHMVATKMYLTGGLGSRWDGEAFGDPYELPPDVSYCETCAAIGSVQWNWRMLVATGEPRYADLVERILYNGMLAGVSQSGDEFFYVNPLQLRADAVSDDHRQPVNGRAGWYDVACCPPNVMRTLASLAGYVATGDGDGIQLHQYIAGTVQVPGGLHLRVTTDYPWDGTVEVAVDAAPEHDCELALRVPAWSAGVRVQVGDDAQDAAPGYWRARRHWRAGDRVVLTLPMPVRATSAHHRVDAARGCVALERGPLVHCVEQVDHPDLAVDDIVLAGVDGVRWAADVLGGVQVLDVTLGLAGGGPLYTSTPHAAPAGERSARADTALGRAIPYYAWGNRGIGPMRVWLPDARPAEAGER